MYTLIAFATQWGSKYGGINSFNADFLSAFGYAFSSAANVICIVADISDEEKKIASGANVHLVPLPSKPQQKLFDESHAHAGIAQLGNEGVSFDADKTVWLGHDRITGRAAVAAARTSGGRSAVIHHMSYDHYESYAEDSQSAHSKTEDQREIFQQADLVLAVGPLLRDAASDLISETKPVHMLIPGLAEIDAQNAPKTFTAFLSGRLSDNAARIKQGQLGIAAFAAAQKEAREDEMPEALRDGPKLLVRGVDFEDKFSRSSQTPQQNPEDELKRFAEEYAHEVVNLHALPYTHDRQKLYAELKRASVAMMPSWHEGFGLTAWEAIAAGVPLIIGEKSGVYRLLKEKYPGTEKGYVYSVNVRGKIDQPYFRDEDLTETVSALKEIAKDPAQARKQAVILRNNLRDRTWAACAEEAADALGWDLKKGTIPEVAPETVAQIPVNAPAAAPPTESKREPLQMPTGLWRAGAGFAESRLLRAEEELLPFDSARQPQVDELNEWLDDKERSQTVRLITGAGGQGKTRLSLELCRQRIESGWRAGFLDSELDAGKMHDACQTLRAYGKPLLIVIDYAETRQPAFLSLLKASLQNSSEHPVRMLLLARDGGEWWDNLPSKDSFCESFLSGYATSGPFRLPAMYAAETDRRTAFDKALKAFAERLEAKAPSIIPDLAGEHFERPLYIQMAALLALHGEAPTTAQGLTSALLNHERRYWNGLLAQLNWIEPARRAERLLALTTLAGNFATPRDAERYWEKAGGGHISSAEFGHFFRALASLYPGTQGLQALRPDLLGEALVAQALLQQDGEAVLDAVLEGAAAQSIRRNALTVLARLSNQRQDVHEILMEAFIRQFGSCFKDIFIVARETNSLLPELAEDAFRQLSFANKNQVAGVLRSSIMEESVQLARLNCAISGHLVEQSKKQFEAKRGNLERMAEYAVNLINHALNLGRIGRGEEALALDRVALELSSRLSKTDSVHFESNYATSLNNYAKHLSEAGRYEEALGYGNQALEIRRRLTQKDPDRFEADYATSLNNYAIRLSEAGRYEEALEHSSQALEIRRRLSQKNPDRFEPDYATSLNSYAIRLSEAGRYEEAFEHDSQALEIRRRLSQKNSDRFEPDYATSLSNYASDLSEVGRYEEALEHGSQALEIYRRLSQKNPDRFEPDYATSLSNYANDLSEAGRYEEALEHDSQALEIRRRLSQKNPDRFEPDYATSLNSYAIRLSEAGRYEEAFEHDSQALEIRRRLSQKNPDRFELDYATSLNSYAIRLSEAGRYEEAFEHGSQALEIRRRLMQKNSIRFADELFNSICLTQFLAWLNYQDKEMDESESERIMSFLPPHMRPLMLLYSAFIKGCVAKEQTARAVSFRGALFNWSELSTAARTHAEPYRLCAAAWCAANEPADSEETDWLDDWRRFTEQRQGRIPQWMSEVAWRLKFKWPES